MTAATSTAFPTEPPTTDPFAQALLSRLDDIALSLQQSGHALALLALGSVGQHTDRLDAFSDLDFFVIVEPGFKQRYIEQLDWLAAAAPLAPAAPLSWQLRNTVDGHKVLMGDGVFCEFAVFEPHELQRIPYAPGRLVWRRPGFDDDIATPRLPLPAAQLPDEAWIVGEALSCLFVGLQRWHRGERLSAARLVQGHALDRLIELDALRSPPPNDTVDPFNRERRLEQRQPVLAAELPALMPGLAHTPAAALALLHALQRRGAVLNPHVTAHIRRLAAAAMAG